MNIWQLKEGSELGMGKLLFSKKPFITILSDHPPGAGACEQIYTLGFEVYLQPISGYWKGWVTTYKQRENNNENN